MAIDKGNTSAIRNLADLYMKKKDYVNVEHYLLMAIEHNIIDAFNDLGWFYSNIKKDPVNAEIYYKIAESHGDILAMGNLALLYYRHNDYVNAEFYSLLAIEHDNLCSILSLMNYYRNVENIVGLINLFTKHHDFIKRTIIVDHVKHIWMLKLDSDQTRHLVKFLLFFEFHIDDDIPTSLEKFITSLKNKTTIVKLHFDYTINGSGFHDAKNDFHDRSLCYN